MGNFPLRPALTIAAFALMLDGLAHVMPGISIPWPEAAGEIAAFNPDTTPLGPLRPHVPPEALLPPRFTAAVPQILQDGNGGLDRFYAALWRTEQGGPHAITRIVHYGDSPTTADLITGDTRQLLQKRFGDAGHGFTLIGKPWAWYEHRGVQLASQGWQMDPGTRWDLRNGWFGLGGVVFTGKTGAYSRVVLRDANQTHLEVWFLRQPGGGTLAVSSGEEAIGEIATDAPARAAGFASFDLKPGTGELEFRCRGTVRIFGITLEKPRDGVVYDSIGLNGASVSVPALLFNESHWAEQLRHRHPDLVILNYGTNESSFAEFVTREYEKELREAIRRVRTALPEASILVMSPMDRAQRSGGEIETLPTIPRIVEIQRRVAGELGCGFFNTFAVMGGKGTMARWYDSQPPLVSADFIHPTPAGARIIASAFVRELVNGLNRYKLRQLTHPDAVAEVR
ncbi:MAG TPA: GDSL-type esterase/lipase family protein [Bryobacteraceae bacterium]|nr:GDSL-type esterase/lipase family protein [Bryobacteraceae bacterium]